MQGGGSIILPLNTFSFAPFCSIEYVLYDSSGVIFVVAVVRKNNA